MDQALSLHIVLHVIMNAVLRVSSPLCYLHGLSWHKVVVMTTVRRYGFALHVIFHLLFSTQVCHYESNTRSLPVVVSGDIQWQV